MQVQNISFINYTFLIGLYMQSNVKDCNLTRKTIVDFLTDHVLILSRLVFFLSLWYYRCIFKAVNMDGLKTKRFEYSLLSYIIHELFFFFLFFRMWCIKETNLFSVYYISLMYKLELFSLFNTLVLLTKHTNFSFSFLSLSLVYTYTYMWIYRSIIM